jgi:hypothetical protein
MPGDDLTHGPPATKNAGGSYHRFGRINPTFPAQWFTVCSALSPVSMTLLVTVALQTSCKT